ncbi:hypothetical protein [Caballeronia sp. TF1N1]|uniref:hypothetical protein n=1 Tax=Caballeronia sp. TF1N1 TaxID=2878153 RepID=UPI001FD22AED|nr:hypothetical protein [Caballeronia sp. TF1N1]
MKTMIAHEGITTELTQEAWQKGTVQPGNYSYDALIAPAPDKQGIDGSEVVGLRLRDRSGLVSHMEWGWYPLQVEPGSEAAKVIGRIVAFYRDNAGNLPSTRLPPMRGDSDSRYKRGHSMLMHFAALAKNVEFEDMLAEALADLMQYAKRCEFNFEEELNKARTMHESYVHHAND